MNSPRRLKLILALSALFVIAAILWQARAALVPFIVGAILAALLSPLVDCIAGRVRLARVSPAAALPISIALVYAVFLGGLAALGFFLAPPLIENITELVQGRGEIYDGVVERFSLFLGFYEERAPDFIKEQLSQSLAGLGDRAGEIISNVLGGSVTVLSDTLAVATGYLVIPVWLVFVLNGRRRASAAIARMFPVSLQPDVEEILARSGRTINRYIRMQVFLAIIVGAMSYVGLYFLGVPHAGPLAIVLGFTELIVIIGPIIGGAIAVLVTLALAPGWAALWVLLLVIGVQQVENQLLVPRLQGSAIEMNPAIIIVLLVVAGQAFGLIGLLVALPVAAVVRDAFTYIYHRLGEVADNSDISGIAPT